MSDGNVLDSKVDEMIRNARENRASDVHISEDMPVWYRIQGRLAPAELRVTPSESGELILALMNTEQRRKFEQGEDVDFSVQTSDGCRQRVNVFRQQGKLAATIRLLNSSLPTLEELKMPTNLYELALEHGKRKVNHTCSVD